MRHDDTPAVGLSYPEAVRRHPRVVVGIAAAALVVGLLWLAARSPGYEAVAEVLVAPIPAEEEAFVGIDVVHESGDATRTVQTAVALLQSRVAADEAATALGMRWSGRDIEKMVSVDPQGESSLVAVTGRAESGTDAVRVANAYASAALRVRDRVVGAQIAQRVAAIDARLGSAARDSPTADALAAQRETLAAASAGDPSLSLAAPALPPASRTGAPGLLMLVVFATVGLAIGAAAALALDALERADRPSAGKGGVMAFSSALPALRGRRGPAPANGWAARIDAGDVADDPGAREPTASDDAWLLDVLGFAMNDAGPQLSRRAFDDWRRAQLAGGNGGGQTLPSASSIARRFGGWSAARARAAGRLSAAGDRPTRRDDEPPPAEPRPAGG